MAIDQDLQKTITAIYPHMTAEDVAHRTGLSPQDVSKVAIANGLRKRPFAHRNRTTRHPHWRQMTMHFTNK